LISFHHFIPQLTTILETTLLDSFLFRSPLCIFSYPVWSTNDSISKEAKT